MSEQENAKDVFRHWTWKKFLVNFLLFATLHFTFALIFESVDVLKSSEPASFIKLMKDAAIYILVLSVPVTIWSPEKENIFRIFKNKMRKKTINK